MLNRALSTFSSSIAVLFLLAAPGLAQGNILLVIADDVGVDRVGAYGEHPDPGNTPTIDSLAAEGVLFRNAWSDPLCSPTRNTLLTGRYGFRNGIGTAMFSNHTWPGVGPGAFTLPRMLARAGYHSEVVGKWHLASADQGPSHPLDAGFAHHRGSMYNLTNYYDWDKSVDGVIEPTTTYATTDTVNDAIERIQAMPEPWFLWVAFNAPHGPVHLPPEELHSFDITFPIDPVVAVKAAIEALDTELARLLAVVEPDTTVVFVGDNGTWGGATDAPFDPDRAKGSVYEGGVNVPLIITGPHVGAPGSTSRALVSVTDLFSTLCELAVTTQAPAGIAPPLFQAAGLRRREFLPWRDSVSMVPYLEDPFAPTLRTTVFAEKFGPNGSGPYAFFHRALRGLHHKLIERLGEPDELYNLTVDPFELDDLLLAPLEPEDEAAYLELKAEMAALLDS